MSNNFLEPVDYCGCGDIGYLTTRSLTIALIQGPGKINNVPVYHCRTAACPKYTIPLKVAHRLDELAEIMEAAQNREMNFYWETAVADSEDDNAEKLVCLQAFLLKLEGRVYEDAKSILLIPGQAVIFHSLKDYSEYYILQCDPEENSSALCLSLAKFHHDKKDLTLADFHKLAEEGLVKELGVFAFEDVEEVLEEEFGNIV
ncbi:MAG TPA: hypothetical protein VN374_04975 [Desulfitobacteriaceae bacterium]|nr:hypothetical protein [Desulfitobacteriaceae bacterium]